MRLMAYVENIIIYIVIGTITYFGISESLSGWGWVFVLLFFINFNKRLEK